MAYDIIIIGAGPAGITAAVYAVRKQLSVVILTGDIGGQTAWSGDIENYTGYQFITGPELVVKFEEHMRKYNIMVKEGEPVTLLEKNDGLIKIRTAASGYSARSVIIASGKKAKELGVPGEKELRNKGLTYCATCDGPLFAGKDVAVIGGGNSALDAALSLMNIVSHVYIVNITPALGGDPIMREKVIASDKVTILNSSRVTSVEGDPMVESILIDHVGKVETINVKGVFVEIGLIPNSEFTRGIDKNESGEIKINCYNETNIPGVFAAGDVTDVPEKQIVIAAGEGAKASLGAFAYLMKQR